MADLKLNPADAQFKKMQRAADGKKAMSEYEAEVAATEAKTARLRAARLAKEAEDAKRAPPVVAKKVSSKKKASKTTAAAPLSTWLDQQKGSGRNS